MYLGEHIRPWGLGGQFARNSWFGRTGPVRPNRSLGPQVRGPCRGSRFWSWEIRVEEVFKVQEILAQKDLKMTDSGQGSTDGVQSSMNSTTSNSSSVGGSGSRKIFNRCPLTLKVFPSSLCKVT